MPAPLATLIKSPDSFGPEHQIRFIVGPVVKLPWKGLK